MDSNSLLPKTFSGAVVPRFEDLNNQLKLNTDTDTQRHRHTQAFVCHYFIPASTSTQKMYFVGHLGDSSVEWLMIDS